MKPKARLKITLRCNKYCKYCINNCDSYKSKWKKISLSHYGVEWNKYRSIIISGGEPTIDKHRLTQVCKNLRILSQHHPLIYLQTNGYGLNKNLVKDIDNSIDGIGYSIHSIKEFEHIKTRLIDISKIKPIRLYIQDILEPSLNKYKLEYFDLKIWKENEFDPTEEIFLLDE